MTAKAHGVPDSKRVKAGRPEQVANPLFIRHITGLREHVFVPSMLVSGP